VSEDRLRASFILFGEETRCQMPWEGGPSGGLSEEEDVQYFCQLRFSPLICDFSLITPLINFNSNPIFQRLFQFGHWF
jgi:hypothetical protein